MKEQWSKIIECAEAQKDLIIETADHIWANPEIGYKEWKTSEYLSELFVRLGYKVTPAGDIPGFIAEFDTGIPGPTIAVFGEEDSLICDGHPDADPETKAVHACGHNTQSAYLVGLAAMFMSCSPTTPLLQRR